MPNGYNSEFTGQHNDEYDDRINSLGTEINTLETEVNTLNTNLNTKVSKSGDTMAGILYTNRNGAVPCCKESSTGTVSALIEEVRYSQGQMGSINITTSSHNVPVGWYNYFYIPHRHGGTGGDNMNYGNLFLLPMTSNSDDFYLIHFTSTTINNAKIYRSIGMIPGTTSQNVGFTASITAFANSWKTFLSGWVAPANGYLKIYLNGNTTPAAQLTDDTNGFSVRENGNGSRDYEIWIPCCKGHSYSGSAVYSKTASATFYPSI